MFSSPTPAPGSRAIASSALRSAGLIDRDAPMRDLTDKQGGRKSSSKARNHRPKVIDINPRRRAAMQTDPSDAAAIRSVERLSRSSRLSTLSGPLGTPVRTKFRPIELWRELVQKRWNPETQFLNLESLIDDELLKKHNIAPPGRGGDARQASVIFKIAKELIPKVQTLSLSNNNLEGVHLQHLSHYLPDLVNLSLENNKIRTLKDLDCLASRRGRLLNLKELVLTGNPVREQGMKESPEQYRRDISSRCTSLEVLDQEVIVQIAFDRPGPSTTPAQKPTASTFPVEMDASFITGVDGSIVSNFLVRFFNAMDTQRSLLINAYDPNATFSFSANTTIAARARAQGFQYNLPNQRKLAWPDWLAVGSRNLLRVATRFDRALTSLHIGADDAVKALSELPGTKHDITGPPEKFCLDSFPVVHGQGMGLLLTVHGQFTEVGTEGLRSFDRSFVLMPAAEGSRAKLNGWDIVIVSDQWTIRVYSSHEAWKPGPLLIQPPSKQEQAAKVAVPPAPQVQPQQHPSLDPQAQAALAAMPEPQRNLVMQISQRTGLNMQFSVECLAGNEWDLNRAIANFEQVKATLSRDAFL
ncbi:hypothetical protein C0991_005177 [Blastosporella zonata]|nr:hypothetical protein C0991_005177 [Blastosporella zonata]